MMAIMKKHLILILAIGFIQNVSNSRIATKKEIHIVLSSIIKDVTRQTNSKGVNVMIPFKMSSNFKDVASNFIKTIPTCQINLKCNIQRYRKFTIYYTDKVILDKAETPIVLHNGGHTPFVFIHEMNKLVSTLQLIAKIEYHYFHMTQSENVGKILLVLITKRNFASLRPIFNYMTLKRHIDVEIVQLRIALPNTKRKLSLKLLKSRKRNCVHCAVHRYNPFSKVYNKVKYTAKRSQVKVQWYRNKLKNFWRFPLDFTLEFDDSYFYSGRKHKNKLFFDCTSIGSPVMQAMQEKLNYSVKLIDYQYCDQIYRKTGVHAVDVSLPAWYIQVPHTGQAFIKLHELSIDYIYVPIICDETTEFSFWTVLLHGSLFLSVILIFTNIAVLFNFDTLTWNSSALTGMVLGIANARRPASALEACLFLFVLTTGFFVTSEIILGALNCVVPSSQERHFASYEDLKKSNLIVYVTKDPNYWDRNVRRNGLLLNSLVNYRVMKALDEVDLMIYTLKYKNSSISVRNGYLSTHRLGDTVYLSGKAVGRKTNIVEQIRLRRIALRMLSPFLDRFSDFHWRFYEAGFSNMREYSMYFNYQEDVELWYLKYYPDDYIGRSERVEESNQLQASFLIIILITGLVSAMIMLQYELISFVHYK